MELKFKIMVLRLLMLIIYKMAFPGKETKDSQDVDKMGMEVHNFIRTMDEFSRAAIVTQAPTPDRPPVTAPAPVSATVPVYGRHGLRVKALA